MEEAEPLFDPSLSCPISLFNAIIEEGIGDMDIANFHELYDEDSDTVTMSCNNVRKPSGTIA